MNYAEVPIPTSNKQSGYSVSLQGANVLSSSHTSHLECQIGRIGAIAINDEGNSGDMIQFLVPQRFESYFPCQCEVNEITFTIDHALPYSPPLSVPSRPPTEATRHDHWNKTACLKQPEKREDIIKWLPKKDVLDQSIEHIVCKKVLFKVPMGKSILPLSSITSHCSLLREPWQLRLLWNS